MEVVQESHPFTIHEHGLSVRYRGGGTISKFLGNF